MFFESISQACVCSELSFQTGKQHGTTNGILQRECIVTRLESILLLMVSVQQRVAQTFAPRRVLALGEVIFY